MLITGNGLNAELHKKLNMELFKNQNYDYLRSGVTAHTFGIDLDISSATCDLDFSVLGYTMTKWGMLQGLYLDYDALGMMCARLLHYKSKSPKKKRYVVDIGMNFKARKNTSGSCLMAMTVGCNEKDGWHCQIFTRASELTMRWYVDLIFVHVLLRVIGEVVGFEPKEVKVLWRMATTYQSITSMPLTLCMYGYEFWLRKNLELFETGQKNDYYAWTQATLKRFRKSYLDKNYQNYKVQERPVKAFERLRGEREAMKPIPASSLKLKGLEPFIRAAFEKIDLRGELSDEQFIARLSNEEEPDEGSGGETIELGL